MGKRVALKDLPAIVWHGSHRSNDPSVKAQGIRPDMAGKAHVYCVYQIEEKGRGQHGLRDDCDRAYGISTSRESEGDLSLRLARPTGDLGKAHPLQEGL